MFLLIGFLDFKNAKYKRLVLKTKLNDTPNETRIICWISKTISVDISNFGRIKKLTPKKSKKTGSTKSHYF